MPKVQGKKATAVVARRAAKSATRLKAAARSAKKSVKKVAAKVVAKKNAKPGPKPAKKPILKAVPKPAPAKASKVAKAAKPMKPVKRAAVIAAPAPKPVLAPKVEPAKKTRARRVRARVHSDGAPVAAWLPQGEKPRPSSFIPAPARAEAPSLVAAPPASSDRLIRPEDVTEFVTRTVPIRVDVEMGGGRVYIGVNPEEVVLRVGEGIEWDFRYLGGADVTVDELVVEFEKPSPFAQTLFRSRKPGAARPHRQLSGAVQKNAARQRVRYTIRAMTPFKTEMAIAKPSVLVE
jgi:hypothetical protein